MRALCKRDVNSTFLLAGTIELSVNNDSSATVTRTADALLVVKNKQLLSSNSRPVHQGQRALLDHSACAHTVAHHFHNKNACFTL